jgi:phosphopantothenoylcysteine decarboxylase
MRVLVLCSGSVATVKVPEIVSEIATFADVRFICSSNAALHFLHASKKYNSAKWSRFMDVGGWDLMVTDEDEWASWSSLGDTVLHIELRRWADLVLVAPASADVLAKASQGISDSLFLSVLRAWDFSKPCVYCPAMNTVMWDHPATNTAIQLLRSWGCRFVGPTVKLLACNERGNGALAPVSDIIDEIRRALHEVEMIANATTTEKETTAESLDATMAAIEQLRVMKANERIGGKRKSRHRSLFLGSGIVSGMFLLALLKSYYLSRR